MNSALNNTPANHKTLSPWVAALVWFGAVAATGALLFWVIRQSYPEGSTYSLFYGHKAASAEMLRESSPCAKERIRYDMDVHPGDVVTTTGLHQLETYCAKADVQQNTEGLSEKERQMLIQSQRAAVAASHSAGN
jgi:hypothetical protein